MDCTRHESLSDRTTRCSKRVGMMRTRTQPLSDGGGGVLHRQRAASRIMYARYPLQTHHWTVRRDSIERRITISDRAHQMLSLVVHSEGTDGQSANAAAKVPECVRKMLTELVLSLDGYSIVIIVSLLMRVVGWGFNAGNFLQHTFITGCN